MATRDLTPLDDLVARMFGGEAPATFDAGALRESIVRQVIQCNAMIHLEMHEVVELTEGNFDEHRFSPDDINEMRNIAYQRMERIGRTVRSLADTLTLPAVLESAKSDSR